MYLSMISLLLIWERFHTVKSLCNYETWTINGQTGEWTSKQIWWTLWQQLCTLSWYMCTWGKTTYATQKGVVKHSLPRAKVLSGRGTLRLEVYAAIKRRRRLDRGEQWSRRTEAAEGVENRSGSGWGTPSDSLAHRWSLRSSSSRRTSTSSSSSRWPASSPSQWGRSVCGRRGRQDMRWRRLWRWLLHVCWQRLMERMLPVED